MKRLRTTVLVDFVFSTTGLEVDFVDFNFQAVDFALTALNVNI